jgi:hypothetical protein
LKAAVWFRRARLVMVPPDPRHPRRSRAGNPLIPLSKFPRPALRVEIMRASLVRQVELLDGKVDDLKLLVANVQ